MQRLLALVFALTFLLGAAGCGNVFVGGAIHTQTISGTVSIVQLTVLSGDPHANDQRHSQHCAIDGTLGRRRYNRASHRGNAFSQWHGVCRYVLR